MSSAEFSAPTAFGRLNVNAMRPFVNAQGEAFVANGDEAIRANAGLLSYDEWKQIDREAVKIATDRLTGIADLQSRGLTHNLGGLGVTISQFEKMSGMSKADLSMSGVTSGEKDDQAFEQSYVPVPIIHKDFNLNIRRLEASRRMGESLDMTGVAEASRLVAERSEDLLFAGSTIKVEGQPIYGYFTHPDRNTLTMATAWDAVAAGSNEDIINDVSEALKKARAANHYGPFIVYVPGKYEAKLDEDYRDLDQRTVRQRIEQLSGVEMVRVSDRIVGDNVALVQMDRNTVDLAIGQDVVPVQWSAEGGMVEHFKVMAAWAPRVKSDFNQKSGIVQIGTGV